MKTFIKVVALVCAGSTLATGTVVSANPQSVTVSYADLNLASDEGVAMLDRRLDRAIERVCGDLSRPTVQSMSRERQCKQETYERIRPQRDIAILSMRDERFAKRDPIIRFAAN